MKYSVVREIDNLPRLPLEGNIDLTYRCNNDCRHCWLRISANSAERKRELSLDEIKRIVDEARKMGCRKWFISGGEPMLRKDFAEIFDYVTKNSLTYTLNTNGTLITPKIAQLLKRKGNKLIALYGATADVHDHITRRPGSFEEFMRGIAYLKEAGVGFTVQIVPMKDNYHQYNEMIKLAESLSSSWRLGAAWLYLSANGDKAKNDEIIQQRLEPEIAIKLDSPDLSYDEWLEKREDHKYSTPEREVNFFTACLDRRRSFHVGPYGMMSFCGFIVDPFLRFNLRKDSFQNIWDKLIPLCKSKIKSTKEYLDSCGSCKLRKECRWCPVYGYLEHQRYSAKVGYLCDLAMESKKFKTDWKKNHRRYFKVADITIQVESDLPINESTFHPKFRPFEVAEPGKDLVSLRHHFSLPDMENFELGEEVNNNGFLAIYRKDRSWTYVTTLPSNEGSYIHQVSAFNDDHTRGHIFNRDDAIFSRNNVPTLTLFSTDQLLLSRIMADREGCSLHSSGVILEEKGYLFVGHSGAGKSTMVKLLRDHAEILCDDRMIIRRWRDGFKIHGNWSHGELPDVSPNSAPLKGVFFLEQSKENKLTLVEEKREILRRLLACLIKPLMTKDWWEKMLLVVGKIAREVPCYNLRFDQSGRVIELLKRL